MKISHIEHLGIAVQRVHKGADRRHTYESLQFFIKMS